MAMRGLPANALTISLYLYGLLLVAVALFSYSFTDPNLVISHNELYWQWQQWMWRRWFDNPPLQATTFFWLMVGTWFSYGIVVWQLLQRRRPLTGKRILLIWLGLAAPFLLAYNALSHDVFNYMFNARMVLEYGANPHQQVALRFAYDPWVRFMHNTHTVAPYGYGWTALSLVPYSVGLEKFLTTWIAFRLMAVSGLLACGMIWYRWLVWLRKTDHLFWLLILGISPFVLSEVVMNAHNDVWMLWPALLSMYLLDRWRVERGWWRLVFLFLTLAASIAIKLATVVLVPVIVIVVLGRWVGNHSTWVARLMEKIQSADVAFFCSLLLFLPLLTARSQYFHPWYLLWSLVWLPLISRRWWQALLIGLMIASTFRYLPWIVAGGYGGTVIIRQRVITWVGGAISSVFVWLLLKRIRLNEKL